MARKWTVFCVQSLAKPIASLPPDLATLFNIPKGPPLSHTPGRRPGARRALSPLRQIAFLDSGKQVLRVFSLGQSPELYADKIATARMAIATVSSLGTFQIPQAVLEHLGYPLHPARYEILMAWTMPTTEWLRYREAMKQGRSRVGEVHIYLSRAEFIDIHRSRLRATDNVLDGDPVEAVAAGGTR